MRRTALVLACLACAGYARKLQTATGPVEEQLPRKALASLLAASSPASAFQVSGAGIGRSPAVSNVATLSELLKADPAISPMSPQADSLNGMLMRPRSNFVPDMQRRTIMNLIVLGTLAPPFAFILYCVLAYFIPPDDSGGAAGLTAKDALGNEVTFEKWLADNQAGARKLVQGIRGDATYLIVTEDKKIEDYGINAVCTHLGCVVPWNRAQNKFMCPCHGSQYDDTGKVVRGPAPLSLALTHVVDKGGKVTFTPWTEQDFRTGQNPWWKP